MLLLGSVTAISLLTSCEGPAGVAGMDGKDANETCILCHNSSSTLVSKIQQSQNSMHYVGSTSERSDAGCAVCHTSQGFIERIATGAQTTAAKIDDPAHINCRTCHMIHENYDTTDFTLRTEAPVVLWQGGQTVDLGGPSNLCVNCHQSRVISPMPVLAGADVSITSSRWGPHHGPQSGTLTGNLGYKISGAEAYPTSAHPHQAAGCTTCHMSTSFGTVAGGHSLNMVYDYHGTETDNIAGCVACHTSAKNFDINGVQTEVEDMMAALRAKFVSLGYINDDPTSPNYNLWKTPLNLTADQAGTLLNYQIVLEDKSMGVHNPAFIKALLKNSMQFWGI